MQNFDYQFNVGGNFTATMDGMAETTGRFNAAVEGTHIYQKPLQKNESQGQTFGKTNINH